MSKTPRTPRTKSGVIRPLGAARTPRSFHSLRNDPALHINSIHTATSFVPIAPAKPIDFTKEKEYQNLRNFYVNQKLNRTMLGRKLPKFNMKEKEAKFIEQISGLEKVIAQLRQQLKVKSDTCVALQKAIAAQNAENDKRLAEQKIEHQITKDQLQATKTALDANEQLLQSTIDEYKSKIGDIISEYEKKLKDLRESKNKELQEKDDKLLLLKQRMADTIGKNSQERQMQLEELKRDLIKQSQEARELQQKLRNLHLKPPPCNNCHKLEQKLEDKTLQLRLKERTVDELQNIGRKMQLQLHQQHRSLVLKKEKRNEPMRSTFQRLGIKEYVPFESSKNVKPRHATSNTELFLSGRINKS